MPEREIVMKKVYCVETKKTYSSIAEAARETGARLDGISKVCLGKAKTTHNLHFQFAASETIFVSASETSQGETHEREIVVSLPKAVKGKGKHHNGNTNPVLCLTDGKLYTSALDAAEQNNVHRSQMSMVCRGILKTAKGKQYCYVKDLPMHLDRISESISKEEAYNKLLEREAKRQQLKAKLAEYKQRLDKLNTEWDTVHDKYEAIREALINMD